MWFIGNEVLSPFLKLHWTFAHNHGQFSEILGSHGTHYEITVFCIAALCGSVELYSHFR